MGVRHLFCGMRRYLLTEIGIKDRVKEAERRTVFIVLVLGVPIVISLFFILPALNLVAVIVGLVALWGIVELISLRRRRRLPELWADYTIEYDISMLTEVRDEKRTAEIQRNEIQLISKYKDGIELHDLDQVIFIPKEIDEFGELVDELSKWRPIEQRYVFFNLVPFWNVLAEIFSFVGRFLYIVSSSSNSNVDPKSKRKTMNMLARKREIQRRRQRYFSERRK